jgi:glycosyltransferase involved in cell wall biosynthesis
VTLAWERFGQRWTTELICVSHGEREAGEAAGISAPVSITPNGVDLGQFLPAQDRERDAARRQLGLPDAPTVVCVGRLARQKGQEDLLDAWPRVREQVPSAQLVLVGDGPDRDLLIARAARERGVGLAGARPDVATFLAAADVIAAPSHWEGMAIAPLEAMASGRSVVATTAAGMTDSVPSGAGSLVEVGEVDALARRLVERLLDPALAATEGAFGRAHVEANHDVNASTRDVARLSLRLYRRERGTADVLASLEPMPMTTQLVAGVHTVAQESRPPATVRRTGTAQPA